MIKWFCFFPNSLLWSLRKYINLLFLFFISTFTLHDFKYQTNDLITSSNYPVQYFKLFFTSISFEVTILSLLTSQIFIGFLATQILLLPYQILTLLYYEKMFVIIFLHFYIVIVSISFCFDLNCYIMRKNHSDYK